MDFYKTKDGKDFLKHLDKVDIALDTMRDMLDDLSNDLKYDYDDLVEENDNFEDSEKGGDMMQKIEDIIDMRDKMEEYKDDINAYVLYDNEPFKEAY